MADAKTKLENVKTQILQIEIDGEIQTVLFHHVPEKNTSKRTTSNRSSSSYFSGAVFTTNLTGMVLSGFKINNGNVLGSFNFFTGSYSTNPTDPICYTCGTQQLDEILITSNRSYTATNSTYTNMDSRGYQWSRSSNNYSSMGIAYANHYRRKAFKAYYENIDEDELTGKAKCIYDKLEKLSTGFKKAIQKFNGEFPLSHLKLTINNGLGSGVYGITIPPVNYVTEVQINGNRLSNLSDLGAAITFSHEIVHAEIFRKLLSAAQRGDLTTSTMTAQEAENYVDSLKDNFPGLYDYYLERWHPNWNHNMMASHYRITIADMIQNFDNNRLPRSNYEAAAWVGLGKLEDNQATVAWYNLTAIEKQAIETLINQNFFNGPSNCN
jgi:hypothetical protein